ncbi:hypothetical protein Pcinc_004428 [Petrolisthes cinctipes]|uniref:Uncharacterized protein n=1 Tax=Petrolisthes cinctipes TaxID=88211 RepID=A0AAE1GH26_PETCI|nr:hypothetical protein Pcinc_004428 [Petrolisthes cinctipes]
MVEAILMVLVFLLSRADCQQLQQGECLQRNDTTVLQEPLKPRVYIRPSTDPDQQVNMSSATLCWRKDDDSEKCAATMNFNISNEINEWRELKIISTTMMGDGATVTVVMMEDFVEVFEGDISKNTQHQTEQTGGFGGDVDEEEVVLGELMVNTSTNLVWAIDCHEHPLPITPIKQEWMSSTSPSPPPATTTTPHMMTAAPISRQEETSTDTNYIWKPLAILALVILLITLLCVVYHYLKGPKNKRRRNDSNNRSVANSMHNGKDMDMDSMEGGLHSVSHSSNTATSTNNSVSHDHFHRRSRLPSNATSCKGERKSVVLHVDGNKNGNTLGRENSYITTTTPGASAAPPPPVPKSIPPIPQPPISSPLPKPSYAPPLPFDVAAMKKTDVKDDDEEHDYDYLDLTMLKVQIEKDKTEEEKMRKRQLDPTMTRHSSENSLYETISITADKRETPEELGMMQSKELEEKEEKTNKMKEGEIRCLVTYDSVNSLYDACFPNSKEQTVDEVIKQDGGDDDDVDDDDEGVDDNKQDGNEENDNKDEDNDNKHDGDDRESESSNESDVSENVDQEEEKDNDRNKKETDNKVSESKAAESENLNQKDNMNGAKESDDSDEEKKSNNDTDETIKCNTKL